MLKKYLKILIVVLVVIATIIIIILSIIKGKADVDSFYEGEDTSELDKYAKEKEDDETKEKVENLLDTMEIFTVNSCVQNYINILNINNSRYFGYNEVGEYAVSVISDDEKKEHIFNLLDSEFCLENNITKLNVYEKLEVINEKMLFALIDIEKISDNNNLCSYVIHGIGISNEDYSLEIELYLVVNIDSNEGTFSIRIIDENLKKEYIQNNCININKINKNNDNIIIYPTIREEDIIKEYMSQYKRIVLSNSKLVFDQMLDKQYRNNRFNNNYNSFEEYIEARKKEIIGINIQKYQVNEFDDYTQYVCIDQNGNYYIFNETAVMDYTVMLDNYTVDLPQFIEKYNNVNEKEKMILNINKFISGINDASYYFAYNLLADSFKNNKFKTQEEFETYIKNNFFEKNKVDYVTFSKEGDNLIYKIKLLDETENSAETINCTVIMQLKEGTDFVMSFSID